MTRGGMVIVVTEVSLNALSPMLVSFDDEPPSNTTVDRWVHSPNASASIFATAGGMATVLRPVLKKALAGTFTNRGQP